MNKLKSYMKKHKLTQRALAKKLAVTNVSVNYWLSGRNKPKLEMAVRIERATGGEVSVYDWK